MKEEEQNKSGIQDAQSDWFLQMLIKLVNDSDLSIGITLQVSGQLVSGDLIGGKAYFDGFGGAFAGPFEQSPEVAKSLRETFSKLGEIYSVEDKPPPPAFVHLRNARFFNTSGEPIPSEGVWWRGRVSEVSGFVLGSLSHSRR